MKDSIKSITVLTVICIAVSLIIAVTNYFTAPIIKENQTGAVQDSLIQVLPEAKSFEQLSLPEGCPETVKSIYREASGLGYAITVETTTSYSKSPMAYTVGINSRGEITGVVMTNYGETKDIGDDYVKSYIGKDSALNGVELVSGATYSSAAFKAGVADAFNTLISMGAVGEGEKSEEQKLAELFVKILPGGVTDAGEGAWAEYETKSPVVSKANSAVNGTGYILVMTDGTVCVVNAFGAARAFTLDGEDITEGYEKLNDAAGAVPKNTDKTAEKHQKVLGRLLDGEGTFTPITVKQFGTVTGAYEISTGNKTIYGFVCHPLGYGKGVMEVYGIIDADGEIVKISADELILNSKYYDVKIDEEKFFSYYNGKNEETLGEGNMVSGATVSSNAVNKAVRDMFAAFRERTGE